MPHETLSGTCHAEKELAGSSCELHSHSENHHPSPTLDLPALDGWTGSRQGSIVLRTIQESKGLTEKMFARQKCVNKKVASICESHNRSQ